MLSQLKSLLEKLKSNPKWLILSQNQPLLRDALEKFMLDESSLTSPNSNPQLVTATYHLRDLEASLRQLAEQKKELEEHGADLTEINQRIQRLQTTLPTWQAQAEQENQAWTNQNAYHLANVDKCKRVLAKLPETTESVAEEVIREGSEFFTQLLEVLEAAVEKLEGKELVEAELQEIKQQKGELEGKLSESETTLTKTRRELDKWKKELGSKEQELDGLKSQLEQKTTNQQDLEQQLTALAISSGLLNQQVEQLNNQLTEAEQREERVRLEAEVKSNLVREQSEKISQQTNQLTNYQNLLRTAEKNLKKGQEIIQQKEEQLEELEKEKNLIAEELELASGKIQELEAALISANSKIARLEAQIQDLESKQDNSSELERVKKELATERQKHQQDKTKSQQEINRLKQELQQTKLREEQLAQKIKELGAKKVKVQEVEKSFWETVKQPLLYTTGIALVLIVLGWIWSKLEQ
ncbi:MAG: hypothetical protein MRERV_24c014 [Mycoplasmataceae bacterium RV_VA103A]|nr:MAG: hypothetical protein MRERV_24c014 [Mycoplasmataceae bacterium RV_VA103A]